MVQPVFYYKAHVESCSGVNESMRKPHVLQYKDESCTMPTGKFFTQTECTDYLKGSDRKGDGDVHERFLLDCGEMADARDFGPLAVVHFALLGLLMASTGKSGS